LIRYSDFEVSTSPVFQLLIGLWEDAATLYLSSGALFTVSIPPVVKAACVVAGALEVLHARGYLGR